MIHDKKGINPKDVRLGFNGKELDKGLETLGLHSIDLADIKRLNMVPFKALNWNIKTIKQNTLGKPIIYQTFQVVKARGGASGGKRARGDVSYILDFTAIDTDPEVMKTCLNFKLPKLDQYHSIT